jgi:hypothetical protein
MSARWRGGTAALESLATAAAWVLVAGDGPDEDMACDGGAAKRRRRDAEGGGQWREGAGASRRCQRGGLGGTVAGRGGGMAAVGWGIGRGHRFRGFWVSVSRGDFFFPFLRYRAEPSQETAMRAG